MNYDVTFEEQNTEFDVDFGENVNIGGGTTVPPDEQMSDTSTNAVQNKVVKAYADNNTVVSKYYSIDMNTLKSNNILSSDVTYVSTGNSTYKLTIGILFAAAVLENGVIHKVIDAPFEFINMNGLVWSNKKAFKNVGISSPETEVLGLSGVFWLDTLIGMIENSGFIGNSGTFELSDVSKNDSGVVSIIITATTQNLTALLNVKGLLEAIFNNSETKLVFEYQNQEVVSTHDASYVYDAAPIEEE